MTIHTDRRARASMLSGKTVLVGVSGGIAAYKALEVVSRLVKQKAQVHVIMTRNATKLVAPLSFRTLSGSPVVVEMFAEPKQWNVEHIALAEKADLFLICPATANVIGKIASGIADDYLTTTVMACTAPKIICPAMNNNMYESPAVQRNLTTLREWGYQVIEPSYGRLASGAMGKGRLPEPEVIVQSVVQSLVSARDFDGLTVMVTAGPTREYLDPVRYISPPSTGRMGYALVGALVRRGARVILVTGPTEIPTPRGAEVFKVVSTQEMLDACLSVYDQVDVVIGAAAPSDFTPQNKSLHKIKKTGDSQQLVLVPTPDILATLGKDKGHRTLVGFAAETHNLVEYALGKIKAKNLDLVCANKVGLPDRGFASDTNAVTLVYPDGRLDDIELASKESIAEAILDRLRDLLSQKRADR